MKAFDFALPDQDKKIHSLHAYHGKWIVLYFYPKDDTPGCTKEACQFRDSFHELEKKGVVILGVSMDDSASHKKFAEKYHLNFPLLSDESGEIIKAYDAMIAHPLPGLSPVNRITYVIDPHGDIVKKYGFVNPLIHAQEILDDLEELQH